MYELSPAVSTSSNDGKLTNCRSSASDDLNAGIDSALGRSVSDQSIGTRQRLREQTTQRLDKAICKVVSFADNMHDVTTDEREPLSHSPVRRPIPKSESHDVGYSSESYSTEEPDGSSAPRGSIAALAGGKGDSVRLRSKNDLFTKEHEEHKPDHAWRYSMTSAYDTSSNCSDRNSGEECNGDCALHSPCVEVAHDKVQNLISVPSKNFYMMTQVEIDTESHSKVGNMREAGTKEGVRYSGAQTRTQECIKNSLLPISDTRRTQSPLLDTWPAMCVINDNESVDPSDNSDSGMIKDYPSDSLQVKTTLSVP